LVFHLSTVLLFLEVANTFCDVYQHVMEVA
jgi:hypothetical protein